MKYKRTKTYQNSVLIMNNSYQLLSIWIYQLEVYSTLTFVMGYTVFESRSGHQQQDTYIYIYLMHPKQKKAHVPAFTANLMLWITHIVCQYLIIFYVSNTCTMTNSDFQSTNLISLLKVLDYKAKLCCGSKRIVLYHNRKMVQSRFYWQ